MANVVPLLKMHLTLNIVFSRETVVIVVTVCLWIFFNLYIKRNLSVVYTSIQIKYNLILIYQKFCNINASHMNIKTYSKRQVQTNSSHFHLKNKVCPNSITSKVPNLTSNSLLSQNWKQKVFLGEIGQNNSNLFDTAKQFVSKLLAVVIIA